MYQIISPKMKNKVWRMLYVVGTTFLLLCSCVSKETPIHEKGKQKKALTAEQIPIQPLIDPDQMVMCGDYLVTCSSRCDTLLSFFLCDSLKFSFGKGSKGEGPEDFTSPWLYNSFDQHLYVRGYSKANVTVAFGIADKDYTPVKRYLQTNALLGLNFGTVLSNDILVGYKHDADIAIWIYDLARDTLLQRTTLELNEHIKEDFYQENRGMTAATAQGTIAYAYRYKNQIDIFRLNEEGKTLQIIQRIGDKQNTNTSFVNNQTLKPYYTNITSTKDKFYALCQNGNANSQWELEVYSSEGEPVITYTFDIAPVLLCIDEKNHYIYGYRYDMPDTFLRYKLDE